MASLKDLRDRIAGVKATSKITKAMQMVAAAKFKRAQDAVFAARPYEESLREILYAAQMQTALQERPALMVGTGDEARHLIVVCTSERGLCGGFNMQIVRCAKDYIGKCLAEGKQVKIITIGKRGADILKRDFAKLIVDHIDLRAVKQLKFSDAVEIAQGIIGRFYAGEFDVCTLFYAQFRSILSQDPVGLQLIPFRHRSSEGEFDSVSMQEPAGAHSMEEKRLGSYEYEPDASFVLDKLVIQNIYMQFFQALLENTAGEMGARMRAMDNATRNAGEMMNKLSIAYNRQRQAQITTELIEIIAGAEAL